MSDQTKTFAEGMYYDDPRDGAPDWVLGKVNIQVVKAIAFLQAHANEGGYVNLDVKRAKNGKPYMELDTWKPSGEARQAEPAKADAWAGTGTPDKTAVFPDNTPEPDKIVPNDDLPF